MRHRFRRLAALLGAALLAVSIAAVPALATEGGETVTFAEGRDDGIISFPTDPAPPTPTPEPTPTPTPEPTPTPTPEPTPTQAPTSTDDPQEPVNDPDNNGPGTGGTVDYTTPVPASTHTPAPTPTPAATPSATARPQIERPKITLNTQNGTPSPAPADDDGPNYKTFAKLNMKTNSMAVTLFYSGAGCLVLGGGGAVTLLALVLKKRRRDSREEIFQEIEEAENRQRAMRSQSVAPPLQNRSAQEARPPRQTSRAPQLGAPQLYGDPSGPARPAYRPQNAASTAPAQEKVVLHKVPKTAPAAPKKPASAGPIVPVAASMYTEEFSLPPIQAQETPVHRVPKQPVKEPAAAPAPEQKPPAARKAKSSSEPTKVLPAIPADTPLEQPKARRQPKPKPGDLDSQLPGQISFLDQ